MASSENLISILIAAKDEASKVIESAAARTKAATTTLNKAQADTTVSSSAFNDVLSKTVLVAGVAAVAIGTIAVKAAGDYQSALTRLVTSAGESNTNLKLVSDGILKVATDTGTSAKELTDAMYIIESAGQHGADGLLVLKAAAQGAKEENAKVSTVADAVSSALQDYHLKATDAAKVTSIFVAAISQGKTTFEQFAGSLSAVLPIASAAHVSLVDVSAAIASMTVHGMSADQATQDLAHSIGKMQLPTQQMTNYLGQLGITSSDLSDHLGTKGITGTLEEISAAIMNKMGPAGKVLIDSLNESKTAVQDENRMIASMPSNLASMARSYQDGQVSVASFRKEVKALPVDQANLLTQFVALQNRASGFNSLLKSGSPEAKSYAASLAVATGDATTLNTALMLTGENTAYVNNAIKAVSNATTEAGGNVRGWSEIQGNFNFNLQRTAEIAQTDAIKLGTVLLPAVTGVLTGFLRVNTAVGSFTNQHSDELRRAFVVVAAAASTFAIGSLVSGLYAFVTAGGLAATAAKALSAALLLIDANPVVFGLTILAATIAAISVSQTHAANTTDALSQALFRQKQAQEDLTTAQNAAKVASNNLTDAQLQREQNAINVQEAQTALNQAVRDFGPASIEARQAQVTLAINNQALKESIDTVTQAQVAADKATVQVAVDQNKAVDAMFAAKDAANQQKASFDNLTTSLGNTKTALQNVAAGNNAITGSVQNKQTITGLKLPGQKFATGTSSAPGGTATLGEGGPELVTQRGDYNLAAGSTVHNAAETRKLVGKGGGAPIVNIGVWNNNSNMDEQKFMAKLGWKLANS